MSLKGRTVMYNEFENNEQKFENVENFTVSDIDSSQPADGGSDNKKHKKTWSIKKKIVALALCCSLLGGAAGAGGVVLCQSIFGSSGVSNMLKGENDRAVLTVSKVDTSKEMTAAEVYATNVNSTVGITTSISTNYFGYQSSAAASGSGFILTDDGYIVTNYHVVEDSNSITVTTYDGKSYNAALIGFDESNDIAVLKINASDLTPVIIGDSDKMNVGDPVVAIGNPLGELTFSLTTGAISALDRNVTFSTGVTMKLIQTDCAINSGNSGGALFNMYGEVIGITNAKFSSSSSDSSASIDNIGFAIPINSVMDIIQDIIEDGYTTKPYIGVTVSNVSEESLGYGLPEGAAVKSVEEGGPAAEAGLKENDIITKVGDTVITSSDDLVEAVGKAQIGDTLTFTVYRQSETITISITVGEQVKSVDSSSSSSSQEDQQKITIPGYDFGY